jgi:hypothetical protein
MSERTVQALIWHPIETAPRDGTYVDLWHKKNRRISDAVWHGCNNEWQYGEDDYKEESEFSHWMSIPNGPDPTSSEDNTVAFEVLNRETGHKWRVFADGNIDGFGDDNIVFNRIPAIIHQRHAVEDEEDES